jgi:hypothetical protein
MVKHCILERLSYPLSRVYISHHSLIIPLLPVMAICKGRQAPVAIALSTNMELVSAISMGTFHPVQIAVSSNCEIITEWSLVLTLLKGM